LGLKQMYRTYVTQDSTRRITKEDQERMKELARQREYMEHSLGILKEKSGRSEERMKGDVQRKVGENQALISDLNFLRRENWELKHQLVLLENQLKSGQLLAAERVRASTANGILERPKHKPGSPPKDVDTEMLKMSLTTTKLPELTHVSQFGHQKLAMSGPL